MKKQKFIIFTICLGMCLAVFIACEDDDGQDRDGSGKKCIPGEINPCNCSPWEVGIRVCIDGDTWTPCDCGGTAGDEEDAGVDGSFPIPDVDKYEPDDNTVMLWHMDAVGDLLADSSGNEYHGIFEGNPKSVPGVAGNAIQFDGENDRIIIEDLADAGIDTITIECWALVYDQNGTGALLDRDDIGETPGLWQVGINPDGQPFFATYFGGSTNNYVTADIDVRDNRFHHFAFTRDRASGEIFIYVDGIKVDEGESPLDAGMSGGSAIGIGSSWNDDYTGRVPYFKGIIDEIRISDIVRDPSEFNKPSGPG